MIYITVGSADEARKIAAALVREQLIACANVFPPVTSVYTWKGEVEEAQEIVMICKTRHSLAAAVSARIKQLHSYEVPCITVYGMEAGFPPYLDWIRDVTKG